MNFFGSVAGKIALSNKQPWSDYIEFVDEADAPVAAFDSAKVALRRSDASGDPGLLTTDAEITIAVNRITWSFSDARISNTLSPGAYTIEILALRGADITIIRGCVDVFDGIVP